MQFKLENVSNKSDLWKDSDPVRPELGVSYKTYPGRDVYGLRDETGDYVAFCCIARTHDVPVDIMTLSSYTLKDGKIWVPYTVWSLKRGAGKAIINAILDLARLRPEAVNRVVTLSPPTEMAKSFHLRNGATEIRRNIATVNFEYQI